VTAIVVYACAYKRIPILLKLVSLLIFDRPIFFNPYYFSEMDKYFNLKCDTFG